MSEGSAFEGVHEHFETLRRVVNEDVLYLYGAVSALVLRVAEGGLTPREQSNDAFRHAVEWALVNGQERTAQHLVIGTWAAFEVYVEDMFVAVCCEVMQKPQWLPKRARALAGEERWRYAWNWGDFGKETGVDRYDNAFNTIGISVNLERLRPSLDDDTDPMHDNNTVRAALRELQAVRNAILHRGGIADERAVKAAPEHFTLDSPMRITGEQLEKYGQAVFAYSGALGIAATERAGE